MMSDWGAAVKPRDDDGDRLQIAIIGHLEWRLAPKVIWFHVPNGGKRSKQTAAKMKRLGVKPGVPDLVFILPDATVAFLELKSRSGRPSVAQTDFAKRCEAIGAPPLTTADLGTALRFLEALGAIKPEGKIG